MAKREPKNASDADQSKSLTNTKTSVKVIKKQLGIYGDPKGEDKWSQFNRLSKRVYDSNMHLIDVNQTWLELPFELRKRLTVQVYGQFPAEWRARHAEELLVGISNTRLFRLHHLSRLKARAAAIQQQTANAAAERAAVHSSSPRLAQPVRHPEETYDGLMIEIHKLENDDEGHEMEGPHGSPSSFSSTSASSASSYGSSSSSARQSSTAASAPGFGCTPGWSVVNRGFDNASNGSNGLNGYNRSNGMYGSQKGRNKTGTLPFDPVRHPE